MKEIDKNYCKNIAKSLFEIIPEELNVEESRGDKDFIVKERFLLLDNDNIIDFGGYDGSFDQVYHIQIGIIGNDEDEILVRDIVEDFAQQFDLMDDETGYIIQYGFNKDDLEVPDGLHPDMYREVRLSIVPKEGVEFVSDR